MFKELAEIFGTLAFVAVVIVGFNLYGSVDPTAKTETRDGVKYAAVSCIAEASCIDAVNEACGISNYTISNNHSGLPRHMEVICRNEHKGE